MSQSVCTLPFEYVDTPERRVFNLEPDGIPCIPALGYSHYSRSRPSVSEHLHPGCLEVTLCMRGSLVFECGGKATRALAGQRVREPARRVAPAFHQPAGPGHVLAFFRLGPAGRPLLRLPAAESDALRGALRGLPRRLFKGGDRLRAAFQRLFRLHDDLAPGPFRTLALRGTVLELLLALVEAARVEPGEPEGERVARLVEAMRAHPERDYSVDRLAREAALSPSQFSTRFKRLTGLPPYTFLLACRVRAAQALLGDPALSVTRIAQQLGFSSSQHFAMQFKRETGLTPSAWRDARPPTRSGP
jgi:AraC-like DNA-binding protein